MFWLALLYFNHISTIFQPTFWMRKDRPLATRSAASPAARAHASAPAARRPTWSGPAQKYRCRRKNLPADGKLVEN